MSGEVRLEREGRGRNLQRFQGVWGLRKVSGGGMPDSTLCKPREVKERGGEGPCAGTEGHRGRGTSQSTGEIYKKMVADRETAGGTWGGGRGGRKKRG